VNAGSRHAPATKTRPHAGNAAARTFLTARRLHRSLVAANRIPHG
jgi:hypothetical protein